MGQTFYRKEQIIMNNENLDLRGRFELVLDVYLGDKLKDISWLNATQNLYNLRDEAMKAAKDAVYETFSTAMTRLNQKIQEQQLVQAQIKQY